MTVAPWRTSASAAATPPSPPPTTSTSQVGTEFGYFGAGTARSFSMSRTSSGGWGLGAGGRGDGFRRRALVAERRELRAGPRPLIPDASAPEISPAASVSASNGARNDRPSVPLTIR